ncbi:hypothetical protein COMNV_00549 [Commensalibacter sp. Nvir]|uniref:hypothetical protein n=1 Tax=Commensalibacter sp. Nvir TaxID=3069817 RepID=UPI002D569855|nr:hypothetical protein COMNV_00549 [Commensalibacter sp. Nvir]
MGDTGYDNGSIFKKIKFIYPGLDLAIINIGSCHLNSLFHTYNINSEKSVKILQDCGALQALGIHWVHFC